MKSFSFQIDTTTWESPTVSSLTSMPGSQHTIAVVIAQNDPDVLADIGNAFRNFYQSGQIWALLVGFILGYMVRGLTTYK
jgi:fructose-specific phosphotransferase system IIC component